MFIATRAAQSAKLRRSGMCLCSLGRCLLFESFVGRGSDGLAKSSVRSAMFIAARAAQSPSSVGAVCLCSLGNYSRPA